MHVTIPKPLSDGALQNRGHCLADPGSDPFG
jgi:hypothetical protein